MDLDRVVSRDSPIHAADPRLKFVATIATILAVTLLPIGAFAALALMSQALMAGSLVARLGPFRLSRAAFIAAPFLLAAVPLIFTRSGDPLASPPPELRPQLSSAEQPLRAEQHHADQQQCI